MRRVASRYDSFDTEPAGRDHGAIAIEAALIFPILVLLVFGIIEWSLVLKDKVELTSISRAGARTGSALSPERPWVAPIPAMTRQVVDSITSAASALPRDTIDYVLVYKAGSDGKPLSGTFSCVGAESTCDRYTWDPLLINAEGAMGDFKPTAGQTWTGSDINACIGDGAMTNIGVFIQAHHNMLTGLFGSQKTIAAYTVMRFEPAQPGRCKP